MDFNPAPSARIILNVAYSYAIISETALEIQKQSNWISNERVQTLKFSNNWVKKFLKRSGLRKRKITRDDKNIPSVSEVIQKMSEGQNIYTSCGHSPSTTWNMDETAVTWAIGPVHVYVPNDQQRASNIGIPNTKLRITAVIAVNGVGEFAPLMFIIKHSVSSESRPDQSTMTVIKKIHTNKSIKFGIEDGWELKLWVKTMTIKGVTAEHKCLYLRHTTTHHVITSQFKAWNDTVRMMMWVELIINPIKERDSKLLLWFDNCGCHKTAVIEQVMKDLDIKVACLPPNMTAILQVLDLVVNGPLKAHIRNNRAKKIVRSFRVFKEQCNLNSLKPFGEREILTFEAPKPDMMECISDLIRLFGSDGDFQKQKFKEGVISSFKKTGTIPSSTDHDSTSSFMPYKEEVICGTMKVIAIGTHPADYFDIQNAPIFNEESVDVHNAIMGYLDREDFDVETDDDEANEET